MFFSLDHRHLTIK